MEGITWHQFNGENTSPTSASLIPAPVTTAAVTSPCSKQFPRWMEERRELGFTGCWPLGSFPVSSDMKRKDSSTNAAGGALGELESHLSRTWGAWGLFPLTFLHTNISFLPCPLAWLSLGPSQGGRALAGVPWLALEVSTTQVSPLRSVWREVSQSSCRGLLPSL